MKREELFDLYKMTYDAFNRQVGFNQNRTRFYLTINIGLFATGLALLSRDEPEQLFSIVFFIIGSLSSFLSFFAFQRGQNYYQKYVVQRVLLEDELGLDDFQFKNGKARDLGPDMILKEGEKEKIIDNPDKEYEYIPELFDVSFYIYFIYGVSLVVNLLGIYAYFSN